MLRWEGPFLITLRFLGKLPSSKPLKEVGLSTKFRSTNLKAHERFQLWYLKENY